MFAFKIWNQGNDGNTMGIRAADVSVVAHLGQSIARSWEDQLYVPLGQYLAAVDSASVPPSPYRRRVDVLWRTAVGYGGHQYFPDRILEATYSGNVRQSGGFAAQCYVLVDPQGFAALGRHHTVPITVAIVPGSTRDLLEVTV